jgi:hypothetical protein
VTDIRHPVAEDGTQLDATFEVEVGTMEIVFHHRARGRDDPAAVNRDYTAGLEVVLERLRSLAASIERIEVDSSVARRHPPADRVLALKFPIRLHADTDIHQLRVRITESARDVARRPGAKPGGGNNQKRLRFWVRGGGVPAEPVALATLLEGGRRRSL